MTRSNGDSDRTDARAQRGRAFDVAIVGAGVIGLSCAWRAARAGLDVCVIERESVGAGASPVAAGMLAPAGEAQWGQGPLARACAASASLWPEFAAELEADSGREVGYERCSALHVALDQDEAAELKRRLPLIRDLDPQAEWCLPSRCRELEPGLAPSSGPGIMLEKEAAVDTKALIEALSEATRALGAELIERDIPAELTIDGDRCAGLRLESGREVRAGAVVVAAGAWAGSLAWLPDEVRPQVRPVKGELVRLRSRVTLASRIVHTERVYVVPRRSGEVIVGATMEEAGFDLTTSAGAVHELLREAYRVLPDIAECEFTAAAAGLRPASADGAPYLGETAVSGLHLACGHFRNGILLAPLSAEAIVGTLSGGEVPAAAISLRVTDREPTEASP